MYVCVCVGRRMCVVAYMYMHVYVCDCVCVHVCVCGGACGCISAWVHVCKSRCLCVYMCMCVGMCMYVQRGVPALGSRGAWAARAAADFPSPRCWQVTGSWQPLLQPPARWGWNYYSVIKNAIKHCHLAEKSYSLGIII